MRVEIDDDNGLCFSVCDGGRGFDPEITTAGSGLREMRDRLAAVGGTVQLTSAPGHGTRILGRGPALGSTENDAGRGD